MPIETNGWNKVMEHVLLFTGYSSLFMWLVTGADPAFLVLDTFLQILMEENNFEPLEGACVYTAVSVLSD